VRPLGIFWACKDTTVCETERDRLLEMSGPMNHGPASDDALAELYPSNATQVSDDLGTSTGTGTAFAAAFVGLGGAFNDVMK